LAILVVLAPGFIGFRLYMIDADWRGIRQIDVLYGSLVFSSLAYGTYLAISSWLDLNGIGWLIAITFASAAVLGVLWKRIGHPALHRALNLIGLTNEDNRGGVWEKIFNDPRIYVTQITAYLKNGEALQCDETKAFDRDELRAKGIFPYYAHRDGQICFVPNMRQRTESAEWEDVEQVEESAEWGLRMVYLNPDELQRLELRITPVKPGPSLIRRLRTALARRGRRGDLS
ncbi:MAG: hypothetical protein RLN85_19375, partial [Pseudomonadales bacterium]